jgi:hypothetical protein
MSHFLRRRRPTSPAEPPAAVPALPGAPAALTDGVRKILHRELCPGERVELVARAGPAAVARLRWRLAAQAGLAAGILALAAVHPLFRQASWCGAWLLPSLLGLVNSWWRGYDLTGQDSTYVVTNERCFRMWVAGHWVHVRDVTLLPQDDRLDPADLLALQGRFQALQARQDAARRSNAAARISRDLPPALREAVHEALMPGETLLWADRPTPTAYLLNAPADMATASLSLLSFAACIATVFLAANESAFAIALGGGALAFGIAAGTCLWRRVRETAYAVTDRGGFVIGPGGLVTTYGLAELRHFQRTQNTAGRGTLAPPAARPGVGFFGVRDVKVVDDLIKGRSAPDRSTEILPAEALPGGGRELSPAERPPGVANRPAVEAVPSGTEP